MVGSFCAAAMSRSYLSCETDDVRVSGSDIPGLSVSDRLRAPVEQLLNSGPPTLPLRVHGARRSDELLHLGPHRTDVVLVALEEFGQGLDRAFVIEAKQLQLHAQQVPELRRRDAVVRLAPFPDAFEHAKAALVEGVVRHAHIE